MGGLYLEGHSVRMWDNTGDSSFSSTVVGLKESYHNNSESGYRIYADNYIEQWGTFGVSTGSWASTTINLLKPMPDTSYNIWLQGNWSEAFSSSCNVTAKTASTATVTYANNLSSVQKSLWRVEGYLS